MNALKITLKGIRAPVLLREEVKASLSTSGNKLISTVFLLVIKLLCLPVVLDKLLEMTAGI